MMIDEAPQGWSTKHDAVTGLGRVASTMGKWSAVDYTLSTTECPTEKCMTNNAVSCSLPP